MNYLLNPITFTPYTFKAFQIVAENRMGLHTVLQTTQLQVKFCRGLFREPVNHPFLVALCDNQAVGSQVSKVFGNRDLGHP